MNIENQFQTTLALKFAKAARRAKTDLVVGGCGVMFWSAFAKGVRDAGSGIDPVTVVLLAISAFGVYRSARRLQSTFATLEEFGEYFRSERGGKSGEPGGDPVKPNTPRL